MLLENFSEKYLHFSSWNNNSHLSPRFFTFSLSYSIIAAEFPSSIEVVWADDSSSTPPGIVSYGDDCKGTQNRVPVIFTGNYCKLCLLVIFFFNILLGEGDWLIMCWFLCRNMFWNLKLIYLMIILQSHLSNDYSGWLSLTRMHVCQCSGSLQPLHFDARPIRLCISRESEHLEPEIHPPRNCCWPL